MALFKISKGLAANLAKNVPNAKEGFAYFTSDDGKFYIDTAGDGTTATPAVVGTNRIPLNAYASDVLKAGEMSTTDGVVYPILAFKITDTAKNLVEAKYGKIGFKNGTLIVPNLQDHDEMYITNEGDGRALVIEKLKGTTLGNGPGPGIEIKSETDTYAIEVTGKSKGIKVTQDPTDDLELATKQYVDKLITDTVAEKANKQHNHSSADITAMTGYTKPTTTAAIATDDTLNQAIGKLEKALDSKQASGNYAAKDHTHTITANGSGDDVITVVGTSGTNAVSYSITHAKKGPNKPSKTDDMSEGPTADVNINGSGAAKSIKVPQVTVDSYGHTTGLESYNLSIPGAATQSSAGFMSAADKKRLDGMADNANKNQNAFGKVKVKNGDTITAITADTEISEIGFTAGENITLSTDTTNTVVTIAAKDTTYQNATTSASGLMSADDKKKLDAIADNANKYELPVATSNKLGGIKSGTDITVDANGNVSVNDNSHNHTISNITGLDDKLKTYLPLAGGTMTGEIKMGTNKITGLATPSGSDSGDVAANKAYVDSIISANDALVFKGIVDLDKNPLPATGYKQGWTYRVNQAGKYFGADNAACEIGDLIICIKDSLSSGQNVSDWTIVQTNIDGAVVGPTSAIDNHVAVFNSTSGKVIKDSGFTIAKSVPADAKFTDTNTWQANTVSQDGYVKAPTANNKNKVWKTDVNGEPDWRDDVNTWQANTADQDGYVKAPTTDNKNKVWKTDVNGVPDWRDDANTIYTLPTASATVKGGIKIGKNLSMNGEVLNATDTTYNDFVPTDGVDPTKAQRGLVPAPAMSYQNYYLNGGTGWKQIQYADIAGAPTNHDGLYYTKSEIDTRVTNLNTAINNKVDKVSGKGLSTNDYTDSEKKRLAGIEEGAQKNLKNFTKVSDGKTTVNPTTTDSVLIIKGGSNISVDASDTAKSITISGDYQNATTSASGLMSADDKKKLDAIADNANKYVHPTGNGNNHIPAGGSAGQILRWSSAGTAVWGADNNTTYSVFTGAKANTDGSQGLVPKPTKGNQEKFLKADGTWSDVSWKQLADQPSLDAGEEIILTPGDNSITISHNNTKAPATAAAKKVGYDKFGHVVLGAVLTKSDVGLGNVDNTSDKNKPISTAMQTALDNKADKSHAHVIADVNGLQTALDGKSNDGHTHPYAGSSSAGGAATSANKVNKSLTIKLNSGTKEDTDLFTFDGSTAKNVNITPGALGTYAKSEIDAKLNGKSDNGHAHLYAGSDAAGGAANSTKGTLTLKVGDKSTTFNGSSNQSFEVKASDLGLSRAMRFIGRATVNVEHGSTTDPKISEYTTKIAGDVILNKDDRKEFVWNGSAWEELGDESSYKIKQTAKDDPSSSGSAIDFIDTISQDANGVITATKKSVRAATATQSGVVSIGAQTFAGEKTFKDNLTISGNATAAKFIGSLDKTLTITLNGGTVEDTSKFIYNNSAAKTVNITPNAIGAYTKSEIDTKLSGKSDNGHTHDITAKVATGADITLAGTSGKNAVTYGATLNNTTVTSGSYGPDANKSPTHGGTFTVPSFTVDAKGRLTAASSKTITLPASDGNDKVTQDPDNGTDSNFPILYKNSANATSETNKVKFDSAITINPKTNTITADKFIGAVPEAYLQWGGKNFSGTYSPMDAALNPALSANRLAGINPAGVVVEYSTDGGSTWSTYDVSNTNKTALFTTQASLRIGGPTGTSATANSRLRITIDGVNGGVYTQLNKFQIYVSTNYSQGCKVSVESYDYNSSTTWHQVVTNQSISGWSGWNVLNVKLPGSGAFGGTNQANHQKKIRFTFSNDSVTSGKENQGLLVYKIYGYGGVGWTAPSILASNGVPYSYNSNLDITFPGSITVSGSITGCGTTIQKGDAVNIIGTSKTPTLISNQLVLQKGAVFSGGASEAGLVTRGICGVTTPTSSGACSKENLYINYDGDNTYKANRQVILQAGEAGTHYGNNLYQYAAARGDAVKGYVDDALEAQSESIDSTYVKKSGDTMTGDLTVGSAKIQVNGYITGTWLRTTATDTHLSSKASKFAVLDSNGWVYHRTASEMLNDLGAQPKITVEGILKGDENGNISTVDELNLQAGNAIDIDENESNITIGVKDGVYLPILENAASASKWNTARTFTIGSTSKSVDGSENVSWSLSEIGAAQASHNHNSLYVKKTGDTMTGVLNQTVDGNPYYGLNDGTTQWYLQALKSEGKVGLGPTWASATKWNASGTMEVAGNVNIKNNSTYPGVVIYETNSSSNYTQLFYTTDRIKLYSSVSDVGFIDYKPSTQVLGLNNKVSISKNGNVSGISDLSISGNYNGRNIELTYSTPYIDFHYNNGTTDFDTRIINDATGQLNMLKSGGSGATVKAGSVWGAVWNDYAEFREGDTIEAGKCVVEVGDDTLKLSTERLQPGANITSDTFGFAIGETDKCKTPIAVSGRVLAYGYEDREEFKKNIGRPVCSGPNGTVSIMTDEEYKEKGYCAIGTISAVPDYEEWGTGNVKVDGRIWIKVF